MPAPSLILARISEGGSDARLACRELKETIDKAGGVVEKIASKLGMSRRSVFRLLARADLTEYAYAARVRSGARDRRNGLSA